MAAAARKGQKMWQVNRMRAVRRIPPWAVLAALRRLLPLRLIGGLLKNVVRSRIKKLVRSQI